MRGARWSFAGLPDATSGLAKAGECDIYKQYGTRNFAVKVTKERALGIALETAKILDFLRLAAVPASLEVRRRAHSRPVSPWTASARLKAYDGVWITFRNALVTFVKKLPIFGA